MLLFISQATKILDICTITLMKWHTKGRLILEFKTIGGHRKYSVKRIHSYILFHLRKQEKRKENTVKNKRINGFQNTAIHVRVLAVK